jgi:phosphotransacetylase
MIPQTVAFSDVTEEDLQKAGIIRKTLCFKPAKVAELAKGLTTNMEAEIINLHSQISRVCAYVDMSVSLA